MAISLVGGIWPSKLDQQVTRRGLHENRVNSHVDVSYATLTEVEPKSQNLLVVVEGSECVTSLTVSKVSAVQTLNSTRPLLDHLLVLLHRDSAYENFVECLLEADGFLFTVRANNKLPHVVLTDKALM